MHPPEGIIIKISHIMYVIGRPVDKTDGHQYSVYKRFTTDRHFLDGAHARLCRDSSVYHSLHQFQIPMFHTEITINFLNNCLKYVHHEQNMNTDL